MTIKANAWCTVHYTTQDFIAISEIGQLHKGLEFKKLSFYPFFLLLPGPVYIGFDLGSGD